MLPDMRVKPAGHGLLSLVATLALALMPVSASGQGPVSARNQVIWHWFGACAGGDSLALEIRLDGKPVYGSAFPICRLRRSEIKPDRQQRLLAFRFDAVPRRFGPRSRVNETEPIEGTIWEAGGEPQAILLGVSFATRDQVLLNMHLVARTDAPSRSERVRGVVITTRPVRRSR